MSRGTKLYLGVLLLTVIMVSTMYFSYAIFTNKIEEHGKLNIVAGTLDYRIESKDLKNNKITVEAKTAKEIVITITSLNDIDSKYELYYLLNNTSNVEIGYRMDEKDNPSGTIVKNGTKEITIIIDNNSDSSTTVEFGVEGGFIRNELVLTKGKSILPVTSYTIINMIEDSSFENDSSIWIQNGTSSIGKITTFTSNTGSKSLYFNDQSKNSGLWFSQPVSFAGSHKIYMSFVSKSISGENNTVALVSSSNQISSLSFHISSKSDSNSFEKYSFSETVNELIDRIQIGISVASIGEFYIDDVMLIDLTATFGAGNEPDKEWCDNHISYFDHATTIYK